MEKYPECKMPLHEVTMGGLMIRTFWERFRRSPKKMHLGFIRFKTSHKRKHDSSLPCSDDIQNESFPFWWNLKRVFLLQMKSMIGLSHPNKSKLCISVEFPRNLFRKVLINRPWLPPAEVFYIQSGIF